MLFAVQATSKLSCQIAAGLSADAGHVNQGLLACNSSAVGNEKHMN